MIFQTFTPSSKDIKKEWFLIDASDLVVGRLATVIARLLIGKHKPSYTPNMDCGDSVIVINANKVKFTGRKQKNKVYYRHTGYPGGLKSETPKSYGLKGQSEKIIRLAVERMLGNNGPLRRKRQRHGNFMIYPLDQHPHRAQMPMTLDVPSLNKKNTVLSH